MLSSARVRLVFSVWRSGLVFLRPQLSRTLVQFCIIISLVSYSQFNARLNWLGAKMNDATTDGGINGSMNRPPSGCTKLLSAKLTHSMYTLYTWLHFMYSIFWGL